MQNKTVWNLDIPLILVTNLNDINQLKVMGYLCFKNKIKRFEVEMKYFTYDLNLTKDDVKKAIAELQQMNLIKVEGNAYYVNNDFIQELVNGTKKLNASIDKKENTVSSEIVLKFKNGAYKIPTELKNKMFPLYYDVLKYYKTVIDADLPSNGEKACSDIFGIAKSMGTDADTIKMAIEALYRNKLVTVTDYDNIYVCLSLNWDKIYNHPNIERIDELREDTPLTFIYDFNQRMQREFKVDGDLPF